MKGGYTYDSKELRDISKQHELVISQLGRTRSQTKKIRDQMKKLCEYNEAYDNFIDNTRGFDNKNENLGDKYENKVTVIDAKLNLTKDYYTTLKDSAMALGDATKAVLTYLLTKMYGSKKSKNNKKICSKKSKKKCKQNKQNPELLFGNTFNKGIAYETVICNYLGSPSAGAGHGVPDCRIDPKGKNIPLEVKLSLSADFGQINMTYESGKFVWSEKSTNEEMKAYYNNLSFTDSNGKIFNTVLDFVNEIWKDKPEKYNLKKTSTKEDFMTAWTKDKAKFKNYIVYIPFETITKFYSNKVFDGKKCNYIQIGHSSAISPSTPSSILKPDKSLGLYHLESNSQKIKNSTKFETGLKENGVQCCKLRIRLKTNSSGSSSGKPAWSFLVALQCVKISKSKASLDDPKRNGTNSATKKLKLF